MTGHPPRPSGVGARHLDRAAERRDQGCAQENEEDEGEGQVGSPVIQANSDVALTGQAATSALGTATTVTFNTIAVSGFSATTAVGEFTIAGKANIITDSVSATTGTGVVNIWSLADDAQNANYSGVDSSQTPNYSNVNDSQTPDWQDVA